MTENTPPSLPTEPPDAVEIPDAKRIFLGNRKAHRRIKEKLPDAPSWRAFRHHGHQAAKEEAIEKPRPRGADHFASDSEKIAVNLALYLRRPLLITGGPGTGKTSLAYAVAYELGLGDVLVWPITSRTTLQSGLYHYDALGHLQDVARHKAETPPPPGTASASNESSDTEIGSYIHLGPLGAALQDSQRKRPRVLLIDEIDKSDIDLPNDLLHLFEEGEFEIPELARLPKEKLKNGNEVLLTVEVFLPGAAGKTKITGGRVQCLEFPVVFLTSNNERDFPPAFLRRCLRLDIQPPDPERLREIIKTAVSKEADTATPGKVKDLFDRFVKARDTDKQLLATDQLLNAMQLVTNEVLGPDSQHLERFILRDLREGGA